MQDKGKMRERVQSDARLLKWQLAEKERAVQGLQARVEAYQELLGHLSQHFFLVAFAEGGAIRTEALGATRAEEAEWLAGLSPSLLEEHSRAVLERGSPATYVDRQAGAERQAWHVALMPAPRLTHGHARSLLGIASEKQVHVSADVGLPQVEELYHRLISLLPQAVVITDEEGKLTFVNPAAVHLAAAHGAEELIGRDLHEFLPEAEAGQWKVCLRQLREGRAQERAELKLRRLDGQEFYAETSSLPIQYQGRFAALNTVRDLSGRRRMEVALAETQDLFYRAFHHAPAAISISRISDGKLIDVNEQFLTLTGYARDDVIGRSVYKMNIWADLDERRNLIETVRRQEAVRDAEVHVCTKGGEVRTVLITVQQIAVRGTACMLAISQDITERNRAAAAEQESRALLYKIFHASPSPICIIRLADGQFVDLNDTFSQFVGYEREELVGKPVGTVDFWPEDAMASWISRATDASASHRGMEVEVQVRSGARRTLLGSFQEIQVKGQACVLAVLNDITERKQAERRLVEAKERAEEMARLKTSFLTNMTHEFRTPLTVILGFTSMLRQGVNRDYQRFVHLIERSGRRLLLMLDSILDLAQLEAGTLEVEREPYNILDVVVGVTSALRPVAEEKGLAFDVHVPDRPIYASLDHAVLARVLNNMLDNAIKFTEKGRVSLSVEADDRNAYLKILDTGVGIDAGFLPRVFEEFSQESTGLERTHQGSGLGLTVSKRLVELIGGSIHVQSLKGKGSLFTLVFPMSMAADAR